LCAYAHNALGRIGKKKSYVETDPTAGLSFLSIEKWIKYVPPTETIDEVIALADPDTQDYLWVIRETMGRVGEINRLNWEDVNLREGYVVLSTRIKRGGNLTPRTVPMTHKLREILTRRFNERDKAKPWVFWHTYWSSKTGEKAQGPYQDRKLLMKGLCKRAGVRYFRYHALRHAGASMIETNNVPIGSIQRILGHENRTTTEIYLHSIGQAERTAMNVYQQARVQSRPESHTESHTENEKGSHPYCVTP